MSCCEIFYALPITKMSTRDGETVTGFRLRWLELINRALGCRVASEASGFRVEPEENEASALIASTFGADTLEALRFTRLKENG